MLQIKYGDEIIRFELPSDQLVGVIEPGPVRAIEDVDTAVRASLENPVAGPPLASRLAGKRTALILAPDYTRPSPEPLILPILDVLEAAGIPATVCSASGRHRSMTDGEIARHFGDDVCRRAQVVQHDAFDDAIHVERGITSRGTPIRFNRILLEHDIVIACGIIEPTYLLGFSGGRKIIMPGIAHHESIDNNHFLLAGAGATVGKLEGNALSDDAEEFIRDLPLDWITYAVVGPDDEAVAIVSGDWFPTHRQGCGISAEIFKVEGLRADIVISSAGGHPYDCDLVQGKKAAVPAHEVVADGGAVIVLAACPEGFGAEETFVEWLTQKTPAQVLEDVTRRELFSLGAHGARILARPIVERGAKVIVVTCPEFARELSGSFLDVTTSLDEALSMAREAVGGDPTYAVIRKARRLIL